jgi:oxygen-independent coproporphyrinogen-3 oxidase
MCFNTYAGQEDLIPAYVEALRRELRTAAAGASGRLQVHTVFFGGGTPSLLTVRQFETILRAIHECFDLVDPEITIEANPGTVTAGQLRDLQSAGVNRISLGMQSAHPGELRMLERRHDYFDVIQAVSWARLAGLENFNLDLIYGLPSQSLDGWQATVKLILGCVLPISRPP